MSNMHSELLNKLIEQNDISDKHMEMDEEFNFYNLVSTGNRVMLEKRGFSLMDKGLGVLSDNPARNVLYHFIVSISMITRLCIEKGMASETAYTLSDLYIQKVDKLKKADEINQLHKVMVFDYTERMSKISNSNRYSKNVSKTIHYINDHINEPISVDDITKEINLNKSYLCSLFKKETNMTIGQYIETKKIDLAKEYLQNTDLEQIDISSELGFISYSYFIKVFKQHTGYTPKEFRKMNYHKYL
ncbi:MAG: AraC family transcriptional regulator [Eubacterium sp.]|nr:AraC family transcriptional regulator [Eubacterium sp.]